MLTFIQSSLLAAGGSLFIRQVFSPPDRYTKMCDMTRHVMVSGKGTRCEISYSESIF